MCFTESKFLHSFFKFLNQEKINYLILRNYQSLPTTVQGTDIDILVDESYNLKFKDKLIKLVSQINYKYWKGYKKNYEIYHMIFVPNQLYNPQDVIRIDFIKNKITWFGMKLMDSKNLWEHKFFHNNLHCLDIPMSITLAILNGLLFAGHVKDKYYEEYDQLGSSEKELVQNYIANTLNESPETIKEEIKNRKFRKIRFRFIKAQRFPFLKIMFGVFSWLHTFFTRFISPPGDFIALVGPDGSGKSTLAEMIKKNCKRIYPGITYFHLFPKLKIFRYFDKKSFKRWENRHQSGSSESALRKKEFGFMASFIRLIYLWLRYTSGYFFEVILKTRKGHLVLSDRWCFDIIFDPGSKGIQLQQWIRKMVFYLIPKPSANLVLIGKPEVFAARKDDLTVEDIQEQITTMKIFFSGSKQSKLIRTDQNPEESFKETLNFLVNRE